MPKQSDVILDEILRDICDLAVKCVEEEKTGVYIRTVSPPKLRALLYRFLKRESNPKYQNLMISLSRRGDLEVWITQKRELSTGNPHLAFKKAKEVDDESDLIGAIMDEFEVK